MNNFKNSLNICREYAERVLIGGIGIIGGMGIFSKFSKFPNLPKRKRQFVKSHPK